MRYLRGRPPQALGRLLARSLPKVSLLQQISVELAAATQKAAPDGLAIRVPRDTHAQHKEGVSRLVLVSWIVVISSAVRVAWRACGQSLSQLLPYVQQVQAIFLFSDLR